MAGFIKRIRQQLQLMTALRQSIQDFGQQQEQYVKLTPEEFLALDPEAQYEAARTRLWDKAEETDDVQAALEGFSPVQRAVYVATYYEMEVNNGGLCQYFVNSSRNTAPYLSSALETIGAREHKAHFDRFIAQNGIDLQALSSFAVRRASQFEKQLSRYPFDAFDDAFYQLPPIEEAARAYVSAHVQDFANL